MRKITEDVYMLPGGKGDSHVYILDDGDGYILIDAGFSEKVSKIDPRKVKFLFLTHSHYDHIAQAWRFPNVYCSYRAFVYIREWDEEIILMKKDFKIKRFLATGIIGDGNILESKKFRLRFIEAPSHTDDSMVIFEEKRRLLFTGDVLFARGILGRMDLKNSVPDKLDKTLRRIISLPFVYLLPGHGPIERREIIKVR